jgi:hypothetical protein
VNGMTTVFENPERLAWLVRLLAVYFAFFSRLRPKGHGFEGTAPPMRPNLHCVSRGCGQSLDHGFRRALEVGDEVPVRLRFVRALVDPQQR